jgi:tetratricopeptide (TPR) repeat protein
MRRGGAPPGPAADRLRPWLLAAATALWVARPLFPSEAAATRGDGLPVVMLWCTLGVCWLLGAIRGRRFSVRFGWTDAAVGLLIGVHALAALWATRQASPRPAVNMLWEWTGLGLGYFLTRQLIGGPRQVRAMIAVMIALAAGLSGYGLYQRTVEMPRAEAQYEVDPDGALREAGVWAPPGSPQRQHFEDRLKNREPIATFALTNSLAAMLAPWLVIALGIAMCSPTVRKAVPCTGCAMLIAACLVLTRSRASYLAVLVGLALAGVARGGRKLRPGWKLPAGIALALGVLVAALVAGAWATGLPPRVLAEKAAKSFGYRLQYWQSTMRMIAEHPLAGCGPGNFQDAYTEYKLPEASEEVADPHNFLLEVWATAGTAAILALLVLLASFARAVWRRNSASDDANNNGGAPDAVSVAAAGGDRATPVFAGGLAGFLLAVPLGRISSAPPSLAATLLGLPLAAACIVFLADWVRNGRIAPALPAIGVVVMLVNLLAAGGMGQPGVAGTFWLLLALALEDHGPHVLPRPAALAMLAAAVALSAACYSSGYSPVLRSTGHVQSAEMALLEGHEQAALEDLEAAARADPLSAEPWRQLAGLTFQQWQRRPTQEKFQRFTQCMTTALERAPRAAAVWLAAGDRYLEAFDHDHRAADREQAMAAYQRAVELYPNNALYHAKFAAVLRQTGDRAGFRREADIALHLDNLNPHEEKKLPLEVRKQLSAGPK